MRRAHDTRAAWVFAWLIIAGGVAVVFAIRAFGEGQPVPVNRSEVAEDSAEPTLTLIGEGE